MEKKASDSRATTPGLPSAAPPAWERWSLAGMIVTVVAFLAPAWTGMRPMYHDDNVVFNIPQFMAVARQVQAGRLPLWDTQTFAGGIPFYVRSETPIYYLPQLPFCLAANLDNLDQAGYVLFVLPFCLHTLWAAVGAFLFARSVLGLRPALCAMVGLIYGLGPDMGTGTMLVPWMFTNSHLPWVMLAIARFLGGRQVRWWVAGVLALYLAASAGQVNYASKLYFVAFLAAAGQTAFTWRLGRPAGNLLALAAVGGMFLVALGLNAPLWFGVAEGESWLQGQAWYQQASREAGGNLPPSALVTLFVPDFLGILDSTHGWGVSLEEKMNSWYFLAGGVFTMFAALTGAGLALRRRPSDEIEPVQIQRAWARIALAGLLVVLLLMIGTRTPLYRPLSTVMPWLQIPRPVYYRFGATWFLALLAGLGMSRLLAPPPPGLPEPSLCRRAGVCIGLALLAAAAALLTPIHYEDASGPKPRLLAALAYQTLTTFDEWGWFLRGPVLYLALASAALATIVLLVRRRGAGWLLVAGVLADILLFAFPWFYQMGLGARSSRETGVNTRIMNTRYPRLTDHPFYRNLRDSRPIGAPDGPRFAGRRSDIDNLAWVTGGYALLGYDSKPLMPRLANVIAPLFAGVPYFLEVIIAPDEETRRQRVAQLGQFLSNMNVGNLVSVNVPPASSRPPTPGTGFLESRKVPEPAPYAYTQNRVRFLDADGQLQAFCRTDLRQEVLVEGGRKGQLIDMVNAADEPLPRGNLRAFRLLQSENPIRRVDRSRANRISVDLEVSRPAMLVLAECYHPDWRATVNGKPVPLWQVNYLQQGLWLTPTAGRCVVELRFFPEAVARGLILAAASVAILVVVPVAAGYLRRRARAKAPAGTSVLNSHPNKSR